MASTEASTIEAPRKRRLPFKRTVERDASIDKAPTTGDATNQDDELAFFRRTDEVFPMGLEEVAQDSEDEAPKKSTPSPQKQGRKRRKVTPEEDEGLGHSSRSVPTWSSTAQSQTPKLTRPSPSRLGSTSRSGAKRSGSRRVSSVVPGSDTDSDDLIMDVKGKGKEVVRPDRTNDRLPTPRKSSASATSAPPAQTSAILLSDSDEDYDPSPRKAKPKQSSPARRSRRNLSRDDSSPLEIVRVDKRKKQDDWDDGLDEGDRDDPVEEEDNEFSMWIAKAREAEAKAKSQDITIKILISSSMPHTVPLVVTRKLSQDLALPLETWVHYQRRHGLDIPDDVEKELFLTWKGNKIWSSATAASLGVQASPDGWVKPDASGEGYRSGGIHFEAWTEEAYADYLKERDLRRAQKLGLSDDEADDSEGMGEDEALPPPAEKKKGLKVVLKAKELEPLKLTIHEHNTADFIIGIFRKQRQVPAGKEVSIWFDGERLGGDSPISDADIDPDDVNQLEVHIK